MIVALPFLFRKLLFVFFFFHPQYPFYGTFYYQQFCIIQSIQHSFHPFPPSRFCRLYIWKEQLVHRQLKEPDNFVKHLYAWILPTPFQTLVIRLLDPQLFSGFFLGPTLTKAGLTHRPPNGLEIQLIPRFIPFPHMFTTIIWRLLLS